MNIAIFFIEFEWKYSSFKILENFYQSKTSRDQSKRSNLNTCNLYVYKCWEIFGTIWEKIVK